MTVTPAPRTTPSLRPQGGSSRQAPAATEIRREQLQQEALRHDLLARSAAERGDMDGAGRAILALLDCERRLNGTGPQVLQVIKPRL
jgi:hypothetical protein